MILRSASSALLALTGFLLYACSSGDSGPASSSADFSTGATSSDQKHSTDTNTGPPAAGTNGDTKPGSPAAGTNGDTSSRPPGPDVAACKAKATADECGGCCFGPYNAQADAPNDTSQDKAVNDCICKKATDNCTADCAAQWCDPNGSVDDACVDCMKGGGRECSQLAQQVCNDDPLCTAGNQCYEQANCDAKPD
jgi:hypothetical protein